MERLTFHAFSVTLGCNLNPSNRFTSSSRFLNCAAEINFPPFPLFIAVTLADIFVYIRASSTITCARRVRYLRTTDAHKQLALRV